MDDQQNATTTPPATAANSSILTTTGRIDYNQLLDKDVLELIGLGSISDEEKAKLYETMGQTIENRVIARMADLLSDEEMEEWGRLADTDPRAATDYLKQHNINIPEIIAEEALLYKSELVSLVNRP